MTNVFLNADVLDWCIWISFSRLWHYWGILISSLCDMPSLPGKLWRKVMDIGGPYEYWWGCWHMLGKLACAFLPRSQWVLYRKRRSLWPHSGSRGTVVLSMKMWFFVGRYWMGHCPLNKWWVGQVPLNRQPPVLYEWLPGQNADSLTDQSNLSVVSKAAWMTSKVK